MIQYDDNLFEGFEEAILDYRDQNSQIYLTKDKLCKCITDCTNQKDAWCYVDKDCPNNSSGFRGYYKSCNPEQTFASLDEADNEISKQKIRNIEEERLRRERERQLEEERRERRRKREEERIERRRKREEERQKRLEYERILERSFSDLINTKGNFSNVELLSIDFLTKLFTADLTLNNQIFKVVIKYRANIETFKNEVKFHRIAAQLGIAPIIRLTSVIQVDDNYENKNLFDSKFSIIVMDYLDPEEWITLGRLMDKSADLLNNYKRRICYLIDILHENNIAHRDLHYNNIMVNIKHEKSSSNVLIIDYDDAKFIQDEENPWEIEKSGTGGKDGNFMKICKKKFEVINRYPITYPKNRLINDRIFKR